ncbi:extracellular protein [Lactiplantibacillus plantarum]|uniref:WxL domain-containing protein n=1 Tax=Lactiplantibacillus plantarum TaxID=1590 RepID=UPI0007B54B3E|nr:WxL domain-containing protein [Lactiplantibacillus plantarum]KZU93604.1 extracellular protein [Lactiplantibacillus plantarum]
MLVRVSKLVSGILVASSLLVSSGVIAQADTPAAPNADSTANTTGTTDIQAMFKGNSSPVSPVNPDNPNKPDNSGDSGNGAKAGGGLSLIYVSNKLDFGSHEIDVLNPETYTAAETDSDLSGLWNKKAVTEVSDVRGSNAGWTLSVAGSSLTGTDGSVMKGATLQLPKGTVTNSGATNNGVQSTEALNVLDGNSATVLSAAKDHGAGVTVDQIDPSNVKLTVPANTAKAQGYQTTLNWSLSDTPAS